MSLQDSVYAADEDDFAQTRGADDLFESEIQPAPLPSPPANAPTGPRALRGRVKGSGHRGGRAGHGGRHPETRGNYPRAQSQEETEVADHPSEDTGTAEKTAPPVNRLLSGGVNKPKLSEDELAARMEKIRLNNQRLTERRRKAEEDETNYEKQEAARKQTDAKQRLEEKKKRTDAEKNRRELDEERERNRQRKLKAVQNREWDSEKKEEDYNPSSLPRYRRGAHGGVSGGFTKPSRSGPPEVNKPVRIATGTVAEWPALPDVKVKESTKDITGSGEHKDQPANPVDESKPPHPQSPGVESSSWADQVEDNGASTPM